MMCRSEGSTLTGLVMPYQSSVMWRQPKLP
jgi:hypothetical protein